MVLRVLEVEPHGWVVAAGTKVAEVELLIDNGGGGAMACSEPNMWFEIDLYKRGIPILGKSGACCRA